MLLARESSTCAGTYCVRKIRTRRRRRKKKEEEEEEEEDKQEEEEEQQEEKAPREEQEKKEKNVKKTIAPLPKFVDPCLLVGGKHGDAAVMRGFWIAFA